MIHVSQFFRFSVSSVFAVLFCVNFAQFFGREVSHFGPFSDYFGRTKGCFGLVQA